MWARTRYDSGEMNVQLSQIQIISCLCISQPTFNVPSLRDHVSLENTYTLYW